jgi:hypothetical protein
VAITPEFTLGGRLSRGNVDYLLNVQYEGTPYCGDIQSPASDGTFQITNSDFASETHIPMLRKDSRGAILESSLESCTETPPSTRDEVKASFVLYLHSVISPRPRGWKCCR